MFIVINEKTLAKSVKEGTASIDELANYFLHNYNVMDMAKAFAELYIASEEYTQQPPISVSQEDYNRILSMFRVRGQKADGTEERRGRPKKD